MNAKPNINVTPLIDVLLVLLIIFMVITPTKPTDFKAKIPSEPDAANRAAAPRDTLVVALDADLTLRLNNEKNLGTIQEPAPLIERLAAVFAERAKNRAYQEGAEFRTDLTEAEKIQKTVFIKAPRATHYGSVVRVIDAVKIAGAIPISLQIDDLN
jgi:biopolymer transport protein ExbD